MNAPTKAADTGGTLSGAKIIAAVKAAGVSHVLSVPDLHTAKGLLAPIAVDKELQLVRVCKEDETLGIAAGLLYGDKRSLILIQYTGFLYAINAIRGVACEQKLPIVMMIGLLGKEPGVAPKDSKRFGSRLIQPMLDTLGIDHHYIDLDEDVRLIEPAINKAHETSRPVAFVIGRRPV